ncbi:hypothetical protein Vsou_23630 [Vulcanisaeta souniana JCM 11219]|uniref:Uncharacterized protein n=1 Tax=Vulcanisaeta souniana JCM 11219 TaxID=1293586 RepID=A0A830EFW6_9CREN|nr:hypothetical protein [Vulcanisaeta souniana]BDR93270.1 hypothetical protein Vsou_23630 [Vulcanisaeta souniana JCM 11219]GGI78873.1 hypothetical protein GCM10007112_14700 [Vulcanisaeta souniana JCM 11219]
MEELIRIAEERGIDVEDLIINASSGIDPLEGVEDEDGTRQEIFN